MTKPILQSCAQLFSERLLNSAIESFVLVGLVSILIRFVPRQNSGTRFGIWFSTLLAIAVLPLLAGSAFVPSHFRSLSAADLNREIVLSSSWAIYLFAAWGAVAMLLLMRLITGLRRVHHLRGGFSEVNLENLDPKIVSTFRNSLRHRQVRFCVSSEVAVPAAFGFFRPAIVFPAWLLPQMSAEEINLIVLHELAHLRRWDDWTNLAQKIVKALFFFHPAVWWIENRLTLEREMACDDMVLAQTTSPAVYASSLISFAEKLQSARSLALAQALVSRMCHMSLRVKQILDTKRSSGTEHWKPLAAVSACMFALVLGAAPFTPRIVAFRADNSIRLPKKQTSQIAMNALSKAQLAGATTKRSEASSLRVLNANISNAIPRARAIPAAFNPRAGIIPMHLKQATAHKPLAVRTKLARRETPLHETFLVFQTTRYDASGSGVWTLCIWRVGGNLTERQLESAIIVSSI